MALPTENTEWATDDNALKENVPEERKLTGWKKLANGFGEKPPLKIYNGWMNLVHRWVKYLASNQTPVGHMIHSTLDEAQFSSVSPGGDWVLADGRNIEGSKFAQLTGRETVPDMRAMYPIMLDSELDAVEYNVVNESLAKLDTPLKYDKGSITPFRASEDPYVSYNISSVKMNNYQTNEIFKNTPFFSVQKTTNSKPGALYYNQYKTNPNRPDFALKAKRFITDSFNTNFLTSSNNPHNHNIIFGNTVTGGGASSNLPSFVNTNSKINRSTSKTVDVSFNDTNRLIPKTYTVNIYIRIN